MSWRGQVRRNSKRRSVRKIWTPSEDDLPLSILAVVASKKSKSKKKPTAPKKVATPTTASSNVIDLENIPEHAEMLDNVSAKIGTFIQSGSFVSSDEDETEMIKAKTNKKASPNQFFISDDSDDDCKIVKQCSSAQNFDVSRPSTSAGTSSNSCRGDNSKSLEDDIMTIVNSVLDKKDPISTESSKHPMEDIKSLEDYRKETEEMLKNAYSLLDDIKVGHKTHIKEKKEESPQKITVGSCPICLESLANRSASVTVCGHIFCKECINETARTLKKCPTCRKSINTKKIHPIYF